MKIYKKPNVIAEIGCNHMGSIKLAKKLIKTAKYCGADYVNFKKEIINICLWQEAIPTLLKKTLLVKVKDYIDILELTSVNI